MTAEYDFVLDQILTVLWKGKLTREGAIGRIDAQLGMSHCDVPTDRLSPEADVFPGLRPMQSKKQLSMVAFV